MTEKQRGKASLWHRLPAVEVEVVEAGIVNFDFGAYLCKIDGRMGDR